MNNSPSPADTKIIFFGNERLATAVNSDVTTVRSLVAAGYNVVAIVSHHSDSRSRSQRPLEIATVAKEFGIPLLLPEKPADIIEQLRGFHADIAVLVAYGKIVPPSVIDIFPHGIINIHPSLLPLHRGPIPIESVILDGSTHTGVSVMQLAKAMDAGPVYGQVELSLNGSESKQQLANNLLLKGGQLVLGLLPGILAGTQQPTAQQDDLATYDALITKEDGLLDFRKPASRLAREVRAYVGWPGSRTKLGTTDVTITAAHAHIATDSGHAGQPGEILREAKAFGLYTRDGSILVIDNLKPAGKQEMTAQAFLNGYGKDL